MKKLLLITLMLFTPIAFATTCPDPSTFKLSGDKLTIKDSTWEFNEYDYYFDGLTTEDLEFDFVYYLKWSQGYGLFCGYYAESGEYDWAYVDLKKKSLTKSAKLSKDWEKESYFGYCEESRKACSW